MLVRCIAKSKSDLKSKQAKYAYSQAHHLEELDITIGEKYIVYGIRFTNDGKNIPWYLICDDVDDAPLFYVSDLFELIDPCIPEGWEVVRDDDGEISFLPKKWARDPAFLLKLHDGDEDAENYFDTLQASANRKYGIS